MVKLLLLQFYKRCRAKPARILFYRDGVSEGQFLETQMFEINQVRIVGMRSSWEVSCTDEVGHWCGLLYTGRRSTRSQFKGLTIRTYLSIAIADDQCDMNWTSSNTFLRQGSFHINRGWIASWPQVFAACQELGRSAGENYAPPITFIVAQKRHNTRFFPIKDADRSGNVPSGVLSCPIWAQKNIPAWPDWERPLSRQAWTARPSPGL